MKDAGVSDELHACALRRLDRVAMLGEALADFAGGNQQQAVDAREGRVQRFRFCIVGEVDLDAACGKIGRSLAVADRRGNLRRGGGLQQAVDHEAAELSAGAGDQNAG